MQNSYWAQLILLANVPCRLAAHEIQLDPPDVIYLIYFLFSQLFKMNKHFILMWILLSILRHSITYQTNECKKVGILFYKLNLKSQLFLYIKLDLCISYKNTTNSHSFFNYCVIFTKISHRCWLYLQLLIKSSCERSHIL